MTRKDYMRRLLYVLLVSLVFTSCNQASNNGNNKRNSVELISAEIIDTQVNSDISPSNNEIKDVSFDFELNDKSNNNSNEKSDAHDSAEYNPDDLPINRAKYEKYSYNKDGVLVIKPYYTDDIHVDSAAINKYESDMNRAEELQKQLDNGKSFSELTEEEREIYGRFERGEDPWFVGEYCGWGCAFWFEEFIASSELQSQNGNTYVLRNLYDDTVDTCWSEGVNGDGIGESFELIANTNMIPRLISIYNGYSKSNETFYNNNRVKTLELTINDEIKVILELEDVMGEQMFILEELVETDENFSFTFKILEIYNGEKHDDTCISEIKIRDGH